jgi:hypothetical protein
MKGCAVLQATFAKGHLLPLMSLPPQRQLTGGDLNRSMQHLHSHYREEDVENEAATEDLLQLRTKKLDVGSLAER